MRVVNESAHDVPHTPAIQSISLAITDVRGKRVILDSDLAALYGVQTKRFNEQVKRNAARFPADFRLQLTADESAALRSQFATLDTGRGRHRKYLPYAFTEHGALMAAMVLGSQHAVEVSVYVVRAFVRLREGAAQHHDLAERLASLEEKTAELALSHDTFSLNARHQLRQVFETLRDLTVSAERPKRPIGFLPPQDTSKEAKATRAKKCA